jgi:hypothetical protein
MSGNIGISRAPTHYSSNQSGEIRITNGFGYGAIVGSPPGRNKADDFVNGLLEGFLFDLRKHSEHFQGFFMLQSYYFFLNLFAPEHTQPQLA